MRTRGFGGFDADDARGSKESRSEQLNEFLERQARAFEDNVECDGVRWSGEPSNEHMPVAFVFYGFACALCHAVLFPFSLTIMASIARARMGSTDWHAQC